MSANGSVSSRSSQILVFPVENVLMGATITVLLGQAKVDDIHQIAFFAQPHQEVVRLDVPVDEVPRVNKIYSTNLQREKKKLKGLLSI